MRNVSYIPLTLLLVAVHAQASPVVSAAAGADATAIQATVDAFRASLGTLNPSNAGSFSAGRREINWDGVPDTSATPNSLAANFFNVTSPRGVVLSTPGTGFAVSADAGSGTAVRFGDINPNYSALFRTFTAERLFTAIGSNVVDVNFFVPGSTTAATVSGFGAIFTDVDLANVSSLQFFDASSVSLGSFFVPSVAGANASLSFLGLRFDAGERIGRVRITAGNQALSSGQETGDVVALDDFIYAEPMVVVTAAIPEPETYALLLAGLGLLGAVARRKRMTLRR